MMKKLYINKTKFLPYLFLSPGLILICGLIFYPITNIFYYSLRNYDIKKPYEFGFIGLENFRTIFLKDPLFYSTLATSVKWVVTQVVIQMLLGLVIALVMNESFKLRGFIRSAVFFPWAVSGVLTSMMWSLMYNYNMGVFNDLLLRLGLISKPVGWTSASSMVFISIVVAELWRGIPFFAILILASLQNIPIEIYEAAKIDGSNRWKSFMYITLPYLKDTIIITTLLRSIWEFNNVDLILTLTGGGPVYMTTTLMLYIVRQGIEYNNFGYGSALAVIVFIILLVFTITYLRISGFGEDKNEK
jgi:multiple sugar transport system permease protein